MFGSKEKIEEGENKEEIPWIHKFCIPLISGGKKKQIKKKQQQQREKGSQILNYALTLQKTFESSETRPSSNLVVTILRHPQNLMLIDLPSTNLSMATSLPTKSHCNLLPYVVNVLNVPWLSDLWVDDECVLIYFILCVCSRGTTTYVFHYFIFLSNHIKKFYIIPFFHLFYQIHEGQIKNFLFPTFLSFSSHHFLYPFFHPNPNERERERD